MTKTYKVLTNFWHNRILVQVGSLIELTDLEVKYLKHAVEVLKEEVEAVVKPAKTVAKEEPKTGDVK